MTIPILYTWDYDGWGPHVPLMKKVFIEHNMAYAGRSLKWIDLRLSRAVRAVGFNNDEPERLLGRDHYAWIPEFGNVAVKEGGKMRLKDFKKGYARLLEEIAFCTKKKMDIILFCHCPFIWECHRGMVIEKICKKPPEGAGLYLSEHMIPEWPPMIFSELHMIDSSGIRITDTSIRSPIDGLIEGLGSPLAIAPLTKVVFEHRGEKKEAIITRVTPSADEKWAILKYAPMDESN